MTNASPTSRIKSLWLLLADSFVLLQQYWVLVYPVMLLLMLIMLVTPQTAAPGLTPQWLFFIGGLLLVMVAFMAGVFNMAHQAVRLGKAPLLPPVAASAASKEGEPAGRPVYAFQLLRYFLPGVGGNFMAFTMGTLIHLLMVAALIVILILLVDQNGGIPAALIKLSESKTIIAAMQSGDIQAISAQIRALSETDLNAINRFLNIISSGLVAYGFLSLLTVFWPVYVTAYETNVVMAYFKSMRHFFRDPLRLLFLGGVYLVISMAINAVFMASGWLAVLRPLVTIVLDVYFVLLLFVYADRHIQPFNQTETGADPAEGAASGDKPQADHHSSVP